MYRSKKNSTARLKNSTEASAASARFPNYVCRLTGATQNACHYSALLIQLTYKTLNIIDLLSFIIIINTLVIIIISIITTIITSSGAQVDYQHPENREI